MAVVKTEKIRFEGADFTKRVRFSSRDGFFRIAMPEAISDVLGVKEARSDTLGKVMREYKRITEKYRKSKTTKRKVIVYKTEAKAYILRDANGEPGQFGAVGVEFVFEAKDLHFSSGCGLVLHACVMTETTCESGIGSDPYVSYENISDSTIPTSLSRRRGSGSIANDSGAHIVDWTPQREKWFARMGRQLEDMVMQVDEMLGDQEKALALMDSGRQLMAPQE